MKLAALFSGGKDSVYALMQVMKQHDIRYLVTFKPQQTDSYMFHHPCVELTPLQAEAIGIQQLMIETSGVKEKELDDMESALANLDIDGIVSGALASNYQKTRIDNMCQKLGLESLAPLWNADMEQHWKNLLQNNFKIIVTGIAADGLDDAWLGGFINEKAVEQLKKLHAKSGLHLGFEGGEAETFVLDCPIFERKITISGVEKVIDKKTNSGYIRIGNARLKEKL